MRMTRSFFIVLILISSPVHAWHDRGHRATAAIAFDAMTEARRRAVVAVLQSHPRWQEDFASQMPPAVVSASFYERGKWAMEQAAVWPDLIQRMDENVRTEYGRSRWHYINLAAWLTDADELELAGKLNHNMSTVFEPPFRQNLNIVQALRGNLAVWHDSEATDDLKAVALCWILHLTGDLHQPLHTVALFSNRWFREGDRGGNNIAVVGQGNYRNLHAFWDGLPTGMDDLTPTDRTVRSIEDDIVDDRAIDEWLSQHANLARRFVYTDGVKNQLIERLEASQPPFVELDSNYLVVARSVARRQVNLAGHRIAQLLN